jgi:glyceraldehyde-3-phosphate dehydrogenase (NADP+)
VGRININTQCSRGPDTLPYSGRRSSALGTISVGESLRLFSTETVVAGRGTTGNRAGLDEMVHVADSGFMKVL